MLQRARRDSGCVQEHEFPSAKWKTIQKPRQNGDSASESHRGAMTEKLKFYKSFFVVKLARDFVVLLWLRNFNLKVSESIERQESVLTEETEVVGVV